jgi:hypothetical protein
MYKVLVVLPKPEAPFDMMPPDEGGFELSQFQQPA